MSSSTEKAAEREEALALAKEKARLEKEPFKTMLEPLSDETKDKLRGWKEPNRAYILLERKVREMNDGETIHWDVMEINVEARPDQKHKVDYYVNGKGWRVIHYGNFPTVLHPNPARAKLAKMHINPQSGLCAWDELKAHVESIMSNRDAGAKQAEIDDLKKKLAEAEAKASKLSKGKPSEAVPT